MQSKRNTIKMKKRVDFMDKTSDSNPQKRAKEYLYVGCYTDINNNKIVKIGTTNDLNRRQAEHTRSYKRAKQYTMPSDAQFEMLGCIPLSKYNTLRYEDKNRKAWQEQGIGQFIRNDRFLVDEGVTEVTVTIRKEYKFAV